MPRPAPRPIPQVEDGFLMRICKALRMTPNQVATYVGVPYSKEFKSLLRLPRAQLAEMDRHDMWWEIKALVGQEIGYLMAIQSELESALQKDREARMKRIERVRDYYGRN